MQPNFKNLKFSYCITILQINNNVFICNALFILLRLSWYFAVLYLLNVSVV